MSKAFLVTGMHRTASSLVAKGLHLAGVDMGEGHLLPADQGNPEGYFEDERVVNANDHVLAANGGTWFAPPESVRRPPSDSRLQRLTRDRGELWGFKDPRLCLTAHHWLPRLGGDPHIVATFRRPERVVDSLMRRGDGLTEVEARALCDTYNRRLLSFIIDFVEVST